MDALNPSVFRKNGTAENVWALSRLRESPLVEVRDLVGGARRAVVVAPHPDDEVLGTGGLLAEFAAASLPTLVVAVTDGEASHHDSRRWTPEALRQARVRESLDALAELGIAADNVLRLRLQDGCVAESESWLTSALAALLHAGDLVFATWSGDGHADHEACGRAAAGAVEGRRAAHCEVPIWMWNWADPEDARLPWTRLVRVRLSHEAQRRKRRALECFGTQRRFDPDVALSPALDDAMLAHFDRPYETLIYAPEL